MDKVEVLSKVRDILSNEGRWIQEADAIDDGGRVVDALDPGACKWCLLGAFKLATKDDLPTWEPGVLALEGILGISPQNTNETITHWNDDDDRSHAEVMALLNRAIEEEKRK